jgi:HlyD family secretion protein
MRIKKVILLSIAPVIIAGAALLFVVVHNRHPQQVLLSGTVETTHIDVASKIAGRVDSLFVREGDNITKGMLLIRLESKEMDARVEQARNAMEAARAKMTMAQNGLRPQEREAVEKLYAQAKVQFELSKKTWNRIQKLYADSVVSLQEHDQVEAQYNAAQEQLDAALARYGMAKEGTRTEDRQAAQSLFHQAESAWHEACAYAQELTLNAPITGEVEKTVAHAGEIIAAGYPIVTIIDTSDMWVVLQIKETSMQKFTKGASFSGTVPALGNRILSFTVTYIAPMADFATWRPTNQRGEFDVRTFEIHLRPASPCPELRTGMTVNFTL